MTVIYAASTPSKKGSRTAAAGKWLQRNQRFVRRLQWGVVLTYALLLITPNLVPLPDHTAHIWNNISLFARFIFWGIWWPGVLLSMLLFGRLWCGLLCPEGALSEWASRNSRGRAIPRWMRWPGWPFTAFLLTTVYGQMISVYQYPAPALLILGGSTVAAMLTGWLYGRNHRVWCRYLCPVSGVFGLLAKLAPLHYGVDRTAWSANPPNNGSAGGVICAPMVPLKTMESSSPCHMCGRCAGFRDAIELRARSPGSEVTTISGKSASRWDSALIIVGLMGTAVGGFLWSSSPWLVAAKQKLAVWLIHAGVRWPLEQSLPWYLLTNNPAGNDVLSVLDGVLLIAFIAATTLVMSVIVGLPLVLSTKVLSQGWKWQRFHHLAHGILPIAACGVILGLSTQTVSLLRQDHILLPWIAELRMIALVLASGWSLRLVWQIAGQYQAGIRRILATVSAAIAILAGCGPWLLLFWFW